MRKRIPYDEEDLALVAAGKMRLPTERLNVKELLKIPTATVRGNKAVQALLSDREEASRIRRVGRSRS
jgi:hypothetical protein